MKFIILFLFTLGLIFIIIFYKAFQENSIIIPSIQKYNISPSGIANYCGALLGTFFIPLFGILLMFIAYKLDKKFWREN
jgi:hypothetical protein